MKVLSLSKSMSENIEQMLNFLPVPEEKQFKVSVNENPEIVDYFDVDFIETNSETHRDGSNFYELLSSTIFNDPSLSQSELDEPVLVKKKSERPHTSGKRQKRGVKSALQAQCKKSYWTKNFLQTGKNPHFKWIAKKLGQHFIMEHPVLFEIREKNCITMADYLVLYRVPEMREHWKQFFKLRVIYRDLMLTRTTEMFKLIFSKFLYRYEEAFESGEFNHIAPRQE